ncbi:MAG: hypothetical protein JWO67_4729 [Streptosporangiaceae bacterium]|nr:hypothetical protein [Streptosporangiaceae bacterium]
MTGQAVARAATAVTDYPATASRSSGTWTAKRSGARLIPSAAGVTRAG